MSSRVPVRICSISFGSSGCEGVPGSCPRVQAPAFPAISDTELVVGCVFVPACSVSLVVFVHGSVQGIEWPINQNSIEESG